VLPNASLGGYLSRFHAGGPDPEPPPALARTGPEIERIAAAAGDDLVVCLGFCEAAGDRRYNTALCFNAERVFGCHRKVHLPPADQAVYTAGKTLEPFDTPVGRMGLLIDYDKTFPEAARALAADGAILLACLSAWPTSLTDPARRLVKDRQARLFDLYDCARAAENQVVLVSANQTGRSGALTFLGNAKVVGPGGDIRARTWSKAGLAVAEVDLAAEVARSRRVLHHLAELRPAAYHPEPVVDPGSAEPASAEPGSAEPGSAEPASGSEVAEPVVVEP
jgi:nitrilase